MRTYKEVTRHIKAAKLTAEKKNELINDLNHLLIGDRLIIKVGKRKFTYTKITPKYYRCLYD